MPFEKGQSGNPKGRPSGRQAFIDRANRFLEEYTIDELFSLARDKERFGQLAVIDGMIVYRLVASLSKKGGGDMDKILDRVIGRATQPINTESRLTLADLVNHADEIYQESIKTTAAP